MAHLIARPLACTAVAVSRRGAMSSYRKAALVNTVRLALAFSRQSHLAVLSRRSAVPTIQPKVTPAASLPWYRKPSLSPNRSMWARPGVQGVDLSSAFDKLTLDSVPRGAIDELSDKLGKLSVQDVSPSAIDELSTAFARLTLNDPVMDDLVTSFGRMTLEQRSASLDDLARLFGKCSLDDDCVSEAIVQPRSEPGLGTALLEATRTNANEIQVNTDETEVTPTPDLSPSTMPLGATSAFTSVHQVNVDETELPTTPDFASDAVAEPDNVEEFGAMCLPPLSVSDFATSGILPLGTRPEDWLPAAASPRAIERVHLVDSSRAWTPFTWGQEPVLDVLVVCAFMALVSSAATRVHDDPCSTPPSIAALRMGPPHPVQASCQASLDVSFRHPPVRGRRRLCSRCTSIRSQASARTPLLHPHRQHIPATLRSPMTRPTLLPRFLWISRSLLLAALRRHPGSSRSSSASSDGPHERI